MSVGTQVGLQSSVGLLKLRSTIATCSIILSKSTKIDAILVPLTRLPNTDTGVVDAQLLQRCLELLVLLSVERVEAGKHHRLRRRNLQQGRNWSVLGMKLILHRREKN
jgi:hypothetical protein